MDLPNSGNIVWQKILTSDRNFELEFLGLQILLSRLKTSIKLNPSNENIVRSGAELRNALDKMKHIPKALRDIKKLLA